MLLITYIISYFSICLFVSMIRTGCYANWGGTLMSFTRRDFTIALAACLVLACSSCATLFQGTTEEVMVASDPDAAQVTVNDGRSGPTPFSMRVPRSEDLQIHVAKVGYTPYDMTDTSHVEWGYLDSQWTELMGPCFITIRPW
jgi:hypothetical protein